MRRNQRSIRVALAATFLALLMALTAQAVTASSGRNVNAAPVQQAQANASVAQATVQPLKVPAPAKAKKAKLSKAQKKARKAKRQRAFVRTCKTSRKFREGQAAFQRHVIEAGRCVTKLFKGVKVIGTRPGHHPTGARALDIMVNTSGSCRAGRKTGNRVAKYLMEFKKTHKVYYVIWRNGYWNARERKKKISNFRAMGRGGCTAGHYDHVHVSFQ